jgi:hypothetical protein
MCSLAGEPSTHSRNIGTQRPSLHHRAPRVASRKMAQPGISHFRSASGHSMLKIEGMLSRRIQMALHHIGPSLLFHLVGPINAGPPRSEGALPTFRPRLAAFRAPRPSAADRLRIRLPWAVSGAGRCTRGCPSYRSRAETARAVVGTAGTARSGGYRAGRRSRMDST